MKRVLAFILVLTFCGSACASLLVNGNFDQGYAHAGWDGPVEGWDSYGVNFFQHSDLGYSQGIFAIAFWETGHGLAQTFPASEGDVFTGAGDMIYSAGVAPLTGDGPAIRVEFWDGPEPTGILLNSNVIGQLSDSDAADVWKSVSNPVVAPAGTTEVRFIASYTTHLSVGKGHIDECIFENGNTTSRVGGPIPADGKAVPSTTTQVRWVNDDDGTLGHYVEVLLSENNDPNVVILAKQAITAWGGSADLPLLLTDSSYRWTVVTYDPNMTTVLSEDIYHFNTGNIPPAVTSSNQHIWIGYGGVTGEATTTLDSIVTDDGKDSPLTYQWESTYIDSATPAFIWNDPNTVPNPEITVTSAGHWQFMLTANDGEFDAEGTVNIYVHADVCEAVKANPDIASLAGDVDGDCETNIKDFAQMASGWAECMSDKLIGIKPECTP